jgi:hypothetical protein
MANPVVELRAVRRDGRGFGYVIWCSTDDCDFAEHVFLKTDAQAIQRGHARDHRTGRVGRGR